jgi:hypothetical protein
MSITSAHFTPFGSLAVYLSRCPQSASYAPSTFYVPRHIDEVAPPAQSPVVPASLEPLWDRAMLFSLHVQYI